MKTVLKLIMFCFSPFAMAQSVSDYPYILIPTKLSNFNDNEYGLSAKLSKDLKNKSYTVLTSDESAWPAEAVQNPCSRMTADLINSSSLFKNKVSVALKDCHDKVLATYTGVSNDKSFDTGYPDALSNALAQIQSAKPQASLIQPKKTSESAKPQDALTTNSLYKNGDLEVRHVAISAGQFMLFDVKNTTAYAIFRESDKKEVYHVKMANGAHALGYMDGQTIIIETSNSDGNFSKEVFSKK